MAHEIKKGVKLEAFLKTAESCAQTVLNQRSIETHL